MFVQNTRTKAMPAGKSLIESNLKRLD